MKTHTRSVKQTTLWKRETLKASLRQQFKCQDGEKVFKALWDLGIILRDQNKTLNLQDCIRITVGTKEKCERVVEAIKQIN